MNTEPKIHSFEELKNELIHFQGNDVLVHIHAKSQLWEEILLPEDAIEITVPFDGKWEKLYKRFNDFYKSTGIQTACYVSKTITWKYKDQIIESPFVLTPLEVKRDKNRQQLTFHLDSENTFLNPFVEKQFREQFEVVLKLDKLEQQIPILLQNPLVESINEISIIGQFHYYRFLFLKELEEIEKTDKSVLLEKLFGNPEVEEIVQEYSSQTILPSDPTQQEVLNDVGHSSFIIQGPPGTGKSQVLINIIGKCLLSDKLFSVVSEKRAALEVIRKKLNALQLADYSIFLDDQTSLKEVYRQIHKTWSLLERSTAEKSTDYSVTTLKKQQLQLLLHRLQTNELSSGISYWKLVELHQNNPTNLEADTYHSVSIKEWQELTPILNELNTLPFEFWRTFQQVFWKRESIREFLKWTEQFQQFSPLFDLKTSSDLVRLNQWCVISQLKTIPHFSELIDIAQSKTKTKEVQKLKKKYYSLQLEIEQLAEKTKSWKTIPSMQQVEAWQKAEQKLFGKRKVRQQLDKFIFPSIGLDELFGTSRIHEQLQQELTAVQQQLIDLSIFDPERDFTELELLQKRYQSIHENQWKSFDKLSASQLQFIDKNSSELIAFSSLKWWRETMGEIEINAVISLFNQHVTLLENKLSVLERIPANVYYWMRLKNSWKEIESQIYCNEWRQFEQLFPELANTSLSAIQELVESIIVAEQNDRNHYLADIHQYRKQQFDAFHQLLLTKTTKLSTSEKEFRQRLKKGKSILVKEMTKSKQHLSLRDLWNSEAKEWIQCLCPIWLMTPTQMAKHFPTTKHIFQLTLIDEASQIPASHIIGTLQRSQQVIIAGDSQQMAPSSFFHSVSQLDILSLAQYYLKNHHLRYHYRSQHPELIHFSNRFFYENELTVFPTNNFLGNPIKWELVENGIYEDGVNIEEAKAVAKHIKEQLQKNEIIGIVAFSETQLQAIWKMLDVSSKNKLQERIEDETAFFKSLDKVQGDECDVLIISFGHGKDKEGNFRLHLGPIIQQGGDKRLNVLFSRAKQQIIFASSITANDFPISENESVQLLKNYFISLEQTHETTHFDAPNFKEWLQTIAQAEELVAKYRVYSERGWEIS